MSDKLMEIYEALYSTFGPRNWWPAEDDFEVMVGAILTQGVAWKNVEKAINNLKALGILSVERILSAYPEVLAQAIRPTMYYNQKATKLREMALHLMENYDGDIYRLFIMDLPELREELLAIKGIGPETADSIILYAAKKPIFVVDAYTRRIFSRLGFFSESITYDGMQAFFMENLPQEVDLYNEYHAQIVNLGKDFCKKRNPRCGDCPIAHFCESCK